MVCAIDLWLKTAQKNLSKISDEVHSAMRRNEIESYCNQRRVFCVRITNVFKYSCKKTAQGIK
jgi:hypothetical protein